MRYFVCSPDYFQVEYDINVHMTGNEKAVDRLKAWDQWYRFVLMELRKECTLIQRPQLEGSPDMVFTANAGTAYKNKVLLANFKNKERKAEERQFEKIFRGLGYDVLYAQNSFEGEGDVLFQPESKTVWYGYGQRSSYEASFELKDFLKDCRVNCLQLVNPKYYHLDTCFLPLRRGKIMYYPGAFDVISQEIITNQTTSSRRIPLESGEAAQFMCNSVLVGNTLFMPACSDRIEKILTDLGYTVKVCPMGEFMKAGGACKCLVMRIE